MSITLQIRSLNSRSYQKQYLPDKDATNCSVEAESEGFASPSDFSGEGLRVLEEVEFRVFDAIFARERLHRYESTRQNFKTKYHSLCRLIDLDGKFSISAIFWQIKFKILAMFHCVW